MSFALLIKELRSLRVFALMIVVFALLDVGYVCFTEFPDVHPLRPAAHQTSERSELIAFAVIFGAIIGASVLSQEREQQTQNFLDGLPVRRWHVFAMKAVAAFTVALLWPLMHLASHVALGWISSTSVTAPLSWSYVGAMLVASAVLVLLVVCAAMALSFLRQWFALGMGLAVWLVLWLRGKDWAWTRWMNTSELMSPGLKDERVISIPWRHLAAHGGLAFLMLLIAGCAYAWRDGWWSQTVQRICRWRWLQWLRVLAPIGAIVIWIALIARFGDSESHPERRDATRAAAGRPAATKDTREGTPKVSKKGSGFDGFESLESMRYRFVHRASQTEAARGLLAGIDAVHDQAAAFFGSPPAPGDKIVVDLAAEVVSHAAAQTNWTKVRMPLNKSADPAMQRRILRHETAHVYIEQLSDGGASDHFNEMRCFHEGAATAAELSVRDKETDAARSDMELWAALAHSCGKVPLELLCDDGALGRQRDPFLVYPLGYVFTRALIRAGGDALPRRAMESLRDHPPPPGAKGAEVWRHLLQRCGVSWESVSAIYEDELAALAKREARVIARLPVIRSRVEQTGDTIIIHPLVDATPVPARLTCQMAADRGVVQEYVPLPMSPDGDFRLSRSEHPGAQLRFMLGWRLQGRSVSANEAWETATLK